jgi:hypothetical protein
MTVILILGLLLPPGAPAAERIKRSTDEKGTIHVGNIPLVGQEKRSDNQAKSGELSGSGGKVMPRSEDPLLSPSEPNEEVEKGKDY